MIEQVSPMPKGWVSVFELQLQRFRWSLPGRPMVVVDCPPHGRGTWPAATLEAATAEAATPEAATATAAESVPPRMRAFGRLVEAGAGHLAAARGAQVEQGRLAAVQARELAAFAALRPAALLDRPEEEVGAAAAASRAARPAVLTPVSEWAVDEVMVALGLSAQSAARLLAESVTLVERLPATLAALQGGLIGWGHARMLTEVLAPLADPATRAAVEARLLAGAAGRTVPQLRAAARRAVLRADASAAAARLAAAIRDRSVRIHPGEDGMAALSATLPSPVALACRSALEQYAAACATPGDPRTKDQRMVDCLIDLILRPGTHGLPPVQAQLTVVAGVHTLTGGAEPGEINGHQVPAPLVRELAHTLGLLPAPDDPPAAAPPAARPPAARPPAAGTPAAGTTDADTGAPDPPLVTANQAAAAGLADLLGLRSTAGTALSALPAIAVVEEISGQLLALTDATAIRRAATCGRARCRTGTRPCTHPPGVPGLGPPPRTPGYTPSAALARFVRARDRRCRFPGCRTAAIRCDLDHNTPWPTGTTSADNLCCLCRHHHRLSHQAPGWTIHRLPDGGLQWTAPGGHTITTHPPRYGTDDHPPPGRHPATPTTPATPTAAVIDPPLTPAERVLGRPHPPGLIDDDPPHF
jgi:hypothetical protein